MGWQPHVGKADGVAALEWGSNDPASSGPLQTLFAAFLLLCLHSTLQLSSQLVLSDYSQSQLAEVTRSLAPCLLVRMSPSVCSNHPEARCPAWGACAEVRSSIMPDLGWPGRLSPEVSPQGSFVNCGDLPYRWTGERELPPAHTRWEGSPQEGSADRTHERVLVECARLLNKVLEETWYPVSP